MNGPHESRCIKSQGLRDPRPLWINEAGQYFEPVAYSVFTTSVRRGGFWSQYSERVDIIDRKCYLTKLQSLDERGF